MRSPVWIGPLLIVLASVAPSTSGHHSVEATYDDGNTVTLTGTLITTRWVNPHATFELEVDRAGSVEVWNIEMAPPHALERKGVEKDVFRAGDRITVEAWPARNGSARANGRTLTLADGRELDVADGWWMAFPGGPDDPTP